MTRFRRWIPTIAIIAAILLFVGAHLAIGGFPNHFGGGAAVEASEALPAEGSR